MTALHWKRPHHTRWLAACLIGLSLATLVGGFNLGLALIFVVVFAVGAVVLSFDGLGVPEVQPEPEPESAQSDEQPLP